MLPALAAALLALLALTQPRASAGLSTPVCDTIGEEFVTEGPRLAGEWPYYSLLYTCSGNLNLEGYAVDACVGSGANCGQAAADAFCRYLGFDFNSAGLFTTTTATAPAISMTGEWCVSPGSYADLGHPNRAAFEAIRAANTGPFCSSLASVTCVRHRDTLRAALPALRAAAAAPAPASPPIRTANVLASPATLSAGRRMMTA